MMKSSGVLELARRWGLLRRDGTVGCLCCQEREGVLPTLCCDQCSSKRRGSLRKCGPIVSTVIHIPEFSLNAGWVGIT
jgi:hypothetical protein